MLAQAEFPSHYSLSIQPKEITKRMLAQFIGHVLQALHYLITQNLDADREVFNWLKTIEDIRAVLLSRKR